MNAREITASVLVRCRAAFTLACIAVLFAAALARSADAVSFRVIYAFGPAPDGVSPGNGLIADNLGRLYGTTFRGGLKDMGTVYRLTPPAVGSTAWSEEVLHSFNGKDGSDPADVLLLGPSGEVYGTTVQGGRYNGGTAFRLDESPIGWTPTSLRNFGAPAAEGAPPDGLYPYAGLTFGNDGLLYGSTSSVVGFGYYGTVFKLGSSGHSVGYRTIHRFDMPSDGSLPSDSMLAIGSDFVGTTNRGPVGGTVFRLHLNQAGRWTENVVYQFGIADDFSYPVGHIISGRGGVLYGCAAGGFYGRGGVFSLTRGDQGQYIETILYTFGAQPNDPQIIGSCGVTINPAGQIFGSTDAGGIEGYGTFFELNPPVVGRTTWTESVLHSFDANTGNGIRPEGAPLRQGGVYYGVTDFASASSPSGSGVVYQITP